jgi:hypothetical protein
MSDSTSHAAIWDKVSGQFQTVAPMKEPRRAPEAVVLASGKVLVVGAYRCESWCPPAWPGGGCKQKANAKEAELYDPATNTWQAIAADQLVEGPMWLLPSGNVFVASSEPTLFEASSGRWFAVPNYIDGPRLAPASTLLDQGRVLVAGGGSTYDAQWPSAEIYEGGRLGDPCATDASCSSGFCADGVCCDRACGGPCEACSTAKKGPGTVEGRCAPVTDGADPDDECGVVGSGVCATPGHCNGQGACKGRAGTLCGAATCPFSSQLVADTCDDAGACVPSVMHECPWDTCPQECQPYRSLTPSKPGTKALGEACDTGKECASKICADGVCCDLPCSGCQACRSDFKHDGGPNGVCGNVKEGTDPHDACTRRRFGCVAATPGFLGDVCGSNGSCVPATPEGNPCGETTCQDATTMTGKICTASGQCVTGSANCGAFACAGGVCGVCCGSASDCAPGLVCKDCNCVEPLTNGATCTSAEQCTSKHCVDGRCCDGACTGQCEACDVVGSEGVCSPMGGAPHGPRPACTGTAGAPCAGSCDGQTRDACVYPAAATPCGAAECSGNDLVVHNCDGQGACVNVPQSCGDYACVGSSCRSSCTTPSDCASGRVCSESFCTANPPPPIDGGAGSSSSGGTSGTGGSSVGGTSGASGASSGGSSGTSSDAGAPGPPADPGESGCGACTTPSRGRIGNAAALGLALLALFARKRRIR